MDLILRLLANKGAIRAAKGIAVFEALRAAVPTDPTESLAMRMGIEIV